MALSRLATAADVTKSLGLLLNKRAG